MPIAMRWRPAWQQSPAAGGDGGSQWARGVRSRGEMKASHRYDDARSGVEPSTASTMCRSNAMKRSRTA